MRYIVVYDIEDDALRTRVARVCERFGVRVQWSVFECRLSASDVAALREALLRTIETPELVNVRVYRVCADCFQASFRLGDEDTGPEARPWLIL